MAKINRIRPPEDIPDSAMADVAFLLLIFFLATTVIAEEFGLTMILPAKSNTPPQQVNRDNVMVISTNENGTLVLIDEQAVGLEAIEPMVREAAAGNDKLVVSIEPARTAPYKAMIDILDEVKAAKHTRISIKSGR